MQASAMTKITLQSRLSFCTPREIGKADVQARALQNSSVSLKQTDQDCQDDKLPPAAKDTPSPCETVQHAAEAVWSSLAHKAVQREARSKKFDEVWPQIIQGLILKGISGVY